MSQPIGILVMASGFKAGQPTSTRRAASQRRSAREVSRERF
jgi:hypothetical protein